MHEDVFIYMKDEYKNYCVYKHTTPSGKIYIGITGQTPEKRWNNGNGYRHNKYFWKAIQKYGWDNIEHEILENNLTRDEACKKEVYYISRYDACNLDVGYNLSPGGDLVNITPIDCYLINKTFIKTFPSILEASYETGISKSAISNACNGLARCAGEYIWRKKGDPLDKYELPSDYIQNKKIKVKIKQYDLDGHLIITHDSLEKASNYSNVTEFDIYKSCIGISNSVNGYVWRFESDEFNKYMKKYKIVKDSNNISHLYNLDNLKYLNLQIYEYNLNGTLNAIYDDVYSIPGFTSKKISKYIDCLTRKTDSYNGFVYRYERDFDLEENGYKRNRYSKRIIQYDLCGNYINTFVSIAEGERKTRATNISQCVNGLRHQSGGFVWRYEGDPFDKFEVTKKTRNITLKYNKPIYEFDFCGKLINKYESLYVLPQTQRANIVKCLNGEISHVKHRIYSYDELLPPNRFVKRIAQYTLDSKLIKIYNSIKEASIQTGATKISDCLNKRIKSSGGFKWEYI